jgi:type III secretion control protein HpaP
VVSRVKAQPAMPVKPEVPVRVSGAAGFAALLRQRRLPNPVVDDDVDEEESAAAQDEDAPAPVASAPPAQRESKASHDDQPPLASAEVHAAAALSPDDTWLRVAEELAHTICGFCNDRAVSGAEGWQVQMDLRADLVADTTLHVTLSPHWLTLRFQARDARSHDLLFKGRDELARLLENTIAPRREIAISFDST